jgi:signal transduction histidine kinase
VRGTLFATCVALSAFQQLRVSTSLWLVSLLSIAAISHAAFGSKLLERPLLLLEAGVAAAGAASTGGQLSPLLPYLLAPAAVAGISDQLLFGIAVPVLEAAVLVAARVPQAASGVGRGYLSAVTEWMILGVGLLALGRWVRRVARPTRPDVQQAYLAAYRLLSQLRLIARELSVGLDALALAEGFLDSSARVVPVQRAAVFVRSQGERLRPLTHRGGGSSDWDTDLGGQNPFAESWASQQALAQRRPLTGWPAAEGGSSLVIPLRTGLATFGLVGLESDEEEAFSRSAVATLETLAEEAGLRLGAALLFEELREAATIEERRRLAREIHDGVAQDLAGVGYLIDEMTDAAETMQSGLLPELSRLRGEVTRIVSDLRLSIFDLRSEVAKHGSLGAALTDYAQTVGRASKLTVHLRLEEAPGRLPFETEAELLRIAQEAITNCRKHAQAGNLWIDLVVRPPHALLRVADDGTGVGDEQPDRFGMQIMRERAARLRADFRILPGDPTGTVVEVEIACPSPFPRCDTPTEPAPLRS